MRFLDAFGGILLFALALFIGWWAGEMVRPPEPHPVEVRGTVERRIHLTMESKWDNDKPRKFTCVEAP